MELAEPDRTAWARAFGRELRALRVFAGLSQERLAARAGVSQRALSRLENGHVGTQLLLVLCIGESLSQALWGRDPGVLTYVSRRLLGVHALAPARLRSREPASGVPGLEEMVRLYHGASQGQRQAVLAALRVWSARPRRSKR